MLFLGSLPLLEPFFNLITVNEADGSSALVTFANLPFEVQLAYPALACWCEELGDGEGCCEGDNNPKINVSVLVEDNPSEVAMAYRQDFCAFVDLVVKELLKVVPETTTTEATTTTSSTTTTSESSTTTFTTTTSTTEPPITTEDTTTTTTSTLSSESSITTSSTSSTSSSSSSTDSITFNIIGSVTDYSSYFLQNDNDNNDITPSITAKDILANSESKKGAMGQLITAFTTLSMTTLKNKCSTEEIMQEKSMLPVSMLGKLDTSVKDTACPKGLSYAPPNESCVEFTIIMTHGEDLSQYDQVGSCLEETINTAIDDGELYKIVKEMDDDTKITGLGNPGAGLEYIIIDGTDGIDNNNDKSTTIITDETEAVLGISWGFIFLIILALFAMPLIVFAVKRNRERQTEEMARVREFAGEPAANDDLENPAVIPVVGAAVGKEEEEEEEKEEEHVGRDGAEDDDSSAPSVWSESRGSQVDIVDEENANPTNPMMGSSLAAMGVASAVATNLYEKKNNANEGKEEGTQPVVAVVGVGEEDEEEEEKQDLESIQAEVRSLVAKTAPGKTVEELLTAYAGKEEELLSHLRRLEKEMS